ncbi:MAG: chromosome segregation protein SMC [Lachnospiraceae bacterium]|nr:chromosome segregation protein SMC [Lachnospiraceae bacterium]
MNFFDYIKNDAFFKPFTLKYRRMYYDCIQILIDKTKELPVLYESDAKDSITVYLKNAGITDTKKNSADDISAAEETETEENGTELQSSEILSLFRECGWLLPREIGRNGEYVVNISIDCRRFMDFLRKMTEKSGEGMMSNRIFAMYDIIKSAFEEDSGRRERPYTNILVPLIDNETELKNELADLKDSISSIMKAVIIFQDINSFGQFIMKDEMLDRFFSEYFFVKNNGLIPSQISFIKGKLRILRQEETCEQMIKECSEKLQLDYDEARERVERYFAELQYFLSVEYETNMELIDNRINNYYNLANTRIMLMASNGVRLEAVINDFLNTVSKMTEKEQNAAMEKVADCTRITNQKYVGYKSFEKNKRIKNEGENIGLAAVELSEEEKRMKTERLFNSSPNRYSVDRVSAFLDVQLGSEAQMNLKEKVIQSKEEILMYAAAMLYAKNEEFPYDIQLSKETVKTEIADITDMTVIKKQKESVYE